MTPAGWITFLGVVLTGVLGLIGAWTSAAAHRRAADRAAEVEDIKVQIAARDQQVESWRADVAALRTARTEDEERCRSQIAELRRQIEFLSDAARRGRLQQAADPPGDTDPDVDGGGTA